MHFLHVPSIKTEDLDSTDSTELANNHWKPRHMWKKKKKKKKKEIKDEG